MPETESGTQTATANARLSALKLQLEPGEFAVSPIHSPTPRHAVLPGIWLDYRPDSGVEVVVTQEPGGLRLDAATTGVSPWFSIAHELPIDRLREGRHLLHVLQASSRGPARFRVCLRYHLPDSFRDVFAREMVVLTGHRRESLIAHRVDPELARDAHGAEVLLFFDGRSFDVTLHAIEAHLI